MKKYVYYSELYHYGIKGQKHGIRRYQNPDGSYTDLGQQENNGHGRYASNYGDSKKSGNGAYSEGAQYFKDKGDQNIKTGKLYSAAFLGLGAAGLIAAGYISVKGSDYYSDIAATVGAYSVGALIGGGILAKNVKNYKKSRDDDIKKAKNSEFNSLSDIPKATINYYNDYFKNSNASAEELMDNINPGYPKPESSSNCMLCTTAMIMRLKGYDVRANTTKFGFEAFSLEDWFSNCEVKRFNQKDVTKASFINQLKSQGDGSYGNLMVEWAFGGGHSILYTVKGDTVHFIDGQINQEYDLSDIWDYINVAESGYVRMNDAIPNEIARGLVLRNK